MQPEPFQLLSASPAVAAGFAQGPLAALVSHIRRADEAASGAAPGEIRLWQVPPVRNEPRYLVDFVRGRDRRPWRPAGCPLCLEAVCAAGQNYAVVAFGRTRLLALANPYGYMPECVTWAAAEHTPQVSDEPGHWESILIALLELCGLLRTHFVGFNGVGNSLQHCHFVSHEPIPGIGRYAVQQAAARLGRNTRCGVALLRRYPAHAWRVAFPDPARSVAEAAALVAGWKRSGGPAASANCAAVVEDGRPILYLFPRSRCLQPWGWRSEPAIMEMAGVFVASDPADLDRLQSGAWDHGHFSRVLASLRTPWGASCAGDAR